MAKIVSRLNENDARCARLQEILEAASVGVVGDAASGAVVQVADNLDDLIDQTDVLFAGMLETVELFGNRMVQAQNDALVLAVELDAAQDTIANLIGGIDYDEALDHATADLMDCFCASGSADVSADGELVFDERITFTKEDLKPMLREAIVRWIEMKLGQ
jgi:hypothetical protein